MFTTEDKLLAVSPIDGRYNNQTRQLDQIFSEFSLIKFRVLVEIKWLLHLSESNQIDIIQPLDQEQQQYLNSIAKNFTIEQATRVKVIEATTNHDVKAVEYFIKEELQKHPSLKHIVEATHFSVTSEDVNNLCHGLMLKQAMEKVILPTWNNIINKLNQLAVDHADIPMMARTHGQPATPTTVGKELANFVYRLNRQFNFAKKQQYLGKFNGAVGNFNAHYVAYPEINWEKESFLFIKSLGLDINPYTTQIEPHDYMAELFDLVARFNNILLDLDKDLWGYISQGYFIQIKVDNEVGSSTMPHKINPIDFENSEGNLGLANCLFNHFTNKLTISRYQRDLSDSTVLRNLGVAFGYSLIAYNSTIKGLNKIQPNQVKLDGELNDNWELLAEPIQTIMRKFGIADPYEKLKELSRGKKLNKELVHQFIKSLELPSEVINELLLLTPQNYIGSAEQLAKDALN